MSVNNGQPASGNSLSDVKNAAEDLLGKIATADLDNTDLFPYGINRVSVVVRAGDAEVQVEISGPDHAHPHDEVEEWSDDDLVELFEEEEDER